MTLAAHARDGGSGLSAAPTATERELRQGLEEANAALARERRRVAELSASEAQYRRLVEHSSDLIFTRHATDGTLRYVSASAATLLGLSDIERVAMAGIPLHPDDQDLLNAVVEGVIRDRQPGKAQVRVRHGDGEYRHFHVSVTPRVDAASTVVEIFSTARDVTDRVVAERERQLASEQVARQSSFTQAVLDTIGVGVVACDADGHLTLFNQATRRFHGIPADPSVDPSEWADRFGLFGADGVTKLLTADIPLARALAEGAVRNAVMTIVPEDLDPVVVRCEGTQLHGPDGSVTGAVVAMTDITESLRAANRLEQAHAELTMALDAMPRSVTLVGVERDADGTPARLRIRWVNAHVRALLHLSLEQLVGRPFAEVFPAVAEEYELIYLQAAVTQEMLHVPVEWFTGDQISGAFEVTVSPWTDDGLLIDVVDVTGRRAAENALRLSEKRLREAQATAGLAGWEWDLATGAVTWSPLMFEMLGVDPQVTPTQELMLSLLDPQEREAFEAAVRSAVHSESTMTLDVRLVRPDGQAVVIRAHATIERDRTGRAVRVSGTDQDVTAAVARETALAQAAHTDSLTGLLNRRGWDAQTAIRLDETGSGAPVAVAMLDLDHFKVLNDTYGHAAGDDLLRECARQWSSRLRASDVIARIGGEEFAILLPGCDLRAAERVVAGLRASVPQPFTASGGVTCLAEAESLAAAVNRADAALYAAKSAGRDQLVVMDQNETVAVI